MLLIGNGRLITRSEINPHLENGAVVLDGEDWDPAIHRELAVMDRAGPLCPPGAV